MQYELMEKS